MNGFTSSESSVAHLITETATGNRSARQDGNGAQANGVGIGHAKGWRLAAEAMQISWMNRAELTQAIPPIYCSFLATQLMEVVGNHEWNELWECKGSKPAVADPVPNLRASVHFHQLYGPHTC